MQTQPFEKHVWAEIDLDALRHNFRAVKARAGALPLCAVVKADSYGHGAVQCARIFAEEGAVCLAVSCLTEAMQLRQDGQTLPILILGHVQPEYAQTLIREDITVACYSTEQAQNLSAAAVKAGGRVKIHLKADTGMGRIGCFSPVTELSDRGLTLIRPLLLATEQEVRTAVKESGFPIVKSRCPADGVTTREDTKDFVRERCRTDRAFRQKTLHALQESGIDGWRPLHPARTSNKEDTAHADTTL